MLNATLRKERKKEKRKRKKERKKKKKERQTHRELCLKAQLGVEVCGGEEEVGSELAVAPLWCCQAF